MPYTLRNIEEVVVNTGTEEHNGWHDPISSRIKTLKMLGGVHGLFLVSFLPLL